MAWSAKSADNIQMFRGSRPKPDVFTQDMLRGGGECCAPGAADISYDKLARRVRFDNGLTHLNPLGGNEKVRVPLFDGLSTSRDEAIKHINAVGVGAQISLFAIPTYAFLTGLGVHIAAEEAGFTFDIVTRNGLVLPDDAALRVDVTGDACAPTRTLTNSGIVPTGLGALSTSVARDYFFRSAAGEFSLEADEVILQVASMPAGGEVKGTFDITVAVSYEVINRAEF